MQTYNEPELVNIMMRSFLANVVHNDVVFPELSRFLPFLPDFEMEAHLTQHDSSFEQNR